MKIKTPNATAEVFHKIEIIEEKISDLKLSVLKHISPSKKNLVSLKGLLKGIDVSDADIQSAKKLPFSPGSRP